MHADPLQQHHITGFASVPNAMTVEVKGHFHLNSTTEAVGSGDGSMMMLQLAASTYRLMELFAHKGVRATFFVLGWVAEREPTLIREIHAAGHEVACHGYCQERISQQRPDQFRGETIWAKHLLEDLIGAPVLGYRAASDSMPRSSWWAMDALVEAGFVYDSSLVPARHSARGISATYEFPHWLRAPGGGRLIEFPLSTARWMGVKVPVASGSSLQHLPFAVTRHGLQQVVNRGYPHIVHLRPLNVSHDLLPLHRGHLFHLSSHTKPDRAYGRLQRLLDEFQYAPVDEVLSGLELRGSVA